MPVLRSSRQATPASWFDSEPAQALFALEEQLLLPRLAAVPIHPWLWLAPSPRWLRAAQPGGRGLRLFRDGQGYGGDARCGLPLPLPSESLNAVVLQHVTAADAAQLLAEVERVLMPGGRVFLTSLNPFSPFRRHWRRHGMVVRTPQRLRQLLDSNGLDCAPTHYLGPLWQAPAGGRGLSPLRAACLFEAEKRSLALPGPTPAHRLRWRAPVANAGMPRTLLETDENH